MNDPVIHIKINAKEAEDILEGLEARGMSRTLFDELADDFLRDYSETQPHNKSNVGRI